MDVRVVRSEGRTKTISAREVDGYLLVRAPASTTDAELQPIIEKLLTRIAKRKTKQALDDDDLQRRAQALNQQYFDGKLKWKTISWVTNQNSRWGSCTPSTGAIRLSHRLAEFPSFVQDYVIVHELAHLLEANHSPRFWAWVDRYPRTERARGYLMAMAGEEQEEEM